MEGSLKEVEKISNIVEVSDPLKVRFGTYILVDDAKVW